jgi:hypothetical protein
MLPGHSGLIVLIAGLVSFNPLYVYFSEGKGQVFLFATQLLKAKIV